MSARSSGQRPASLALLALAGLVVTIFAQGIVAGREHVLDGVLLYAVGLWLVLTGLRALPSWPRGPHPNPLPEGEGVVPRPAPPPLREGVVSHPGSLPEGAVPHLNPLPEGEGTGRAPSSVESVRESADGEAPRRDSRLPLELAVAAAVASAFGLFLFADGSHPTLAWLLYLGSLALAVAAAWRYDGPRPRLALRPPTAHGAALLGILALGFAFRAYHLGSLPAGLWWDEAFSGLRVDRILADPSFRPVFEGGRAQGAAALWYTMVPFVLALGKTAAGLRGTVVLGGTLGILATYLLGRELLGRRVGLVAAAVIAFLPWHVTFSRLAFNSIWSVTLDALTAYLLIRAIRTRRLFDFALGGLALGLGLNMYYTSRLLPIVLAIYLLHRLALERGALVRRLVPGLLVLAAVALLAIAPLIQFAIDNPKEFESRLTEASVFREVQSTGSLAPIVANLRDHVLMFNYAGDRNGRHNLPGAPMLPPAVGAAFVVGLALSIRRIRRPDHSFLLAWVVVMLVGGVFSLRFESPQSLRTVDETTGVALLAALPIVGIWRAFEALPIGRVRVRLAAFAQPTIAASLAAAIVAVVAVMGYQRYFVQQAGDFASWAAASTAETIAAETIDALPADYQIYLDETMIGHPTLEYLTDRSGEFRRFEESTSMPFSEASGVAVLVKPEREGAVAGLERLYPDAAVEEVHPPFGGPVVLYAVTVPPDEVASLQGAVADYYRGDSFDVEPEKTEKVGALDFDYARSAPLPFPFAVEVSGTLLVPEYGSYTLTLDAPGDAELSLDGTPFTTGGKRQSAALARGLHTLTLRAVVRAPGRVQVLWTRPSGGAPASLAGALFAPSVPSTGLLGSYYPNANWSGSPKLEQIDPELSIRFHILPLPRPYGVEWTGKLVVPKDGLYGFAAAASSDAKVYVDDRQVASSASGSRDVSEGQPVQLTAGLHDIRVRFVDSAQFSFVQVYWTPPGEKRQPIPGSYLLPPRGAYPDLSTLVEQAPTTPTPTPPAVWEERGGIPVSSMQPGATLGQDAQLLDPRGVAVDEDGNVYVADTGNARIVKLSPTGDVLATWGQKGTGEGEFQEPVAVAVEPTGDVLVLDGVDGYVRRFSPSGEFVARFAGPAIRPYHPRGIAVDVDGTISIADTGASRIAQLDPDGRLAASLGKRGAEPGQLVEPTDVRRLPDGGFVVVDSANDRALVLDPDFNLTHQWPLPPNDSVWGPHIALDEAGGIYVSDPAHHRIVHFGSDGEILDQIGGAGELERPVGLATDADGRLYVADSATGTIQVYEP